MKGADSWVSCAECYLNFQVRKKILLEEYKRGAERQLTEYQNAE
jgi:hypothetical protein